MNQNIEKKLEKLYTELGDYLDGSSSPEDNGNNSSNNKSGDTSSDGSEESNVTENNPTDNTNTPNDETDSTGQDEDISSDDIDNEEPDKAEDSDATGEHKSGLVISDDKNGFSYDVDAIENMMRCLNTLEELESDPSYGKIDYSKMHTTSHDTNWRQKNYTNGVSTLAYIFPIKYKMEEYTDRIDYQENTSKATKALSETITILSNKFNDVFSDDVMEIANKNTGDGLTINDPDYANFEDEDGEDTDSGSATDGNPSTEEHDSGDKIIDDTIKEKVEDIVNNIPDEIKNGVINKLINGKTPAEIAQEYGITEEQIEAIKGLVISSLE